MDPSMMVAVDPDDAPVNAERLHPLHVKSCPSPRPSSVSYWIPPKTVDLPFDWNDEKNNHITNAEPRVLRAGKAEHRAWDALVLSCMAPEHTDIALAAYLGPEAEIKEGEFHCRSGVRWGVPLVVGGLQGIEREIACADTGSEGNIISYNLAKKLHLIIEVAEEQQEFVLANDTRVKAMGRTSTYCWFSWEDTAKSDPIECTFHVFRQLASPMIMGMKFLQDTETLANHRKRLEKLKIPRLQALQVCSVGRPSRGLVCFLDGTLTLATPDSGSDLDLMSPRFAVERGLKVIDLVEKIEFADGSTTFTCGVVRVEIAISNGEHGIAHIPGRRIPVVEFHLLESFTHDVLLGTNTLEQLDIFTHNSHVLIPVADTDGPMRLDRIHVVGTLDRMIAWTKERINHQKKSRGPLTRLPQGPLLDDQRENDRREREDRRIASLPPIKQAEETRDEARKRANYEKIQATWPTNKTSSSSSKSDGQTGSSGKCNVSPSFKRARLA
ncbi:hypothetical protein BDV96DRAFT_653880 [Lophiotrema nucula]|uniref:Aspartic peptidase domain-containing protein n=1 Tax=Lophiotrema nucula TaxID=690887 RepID=A0A6A5YMA2_9PLEO|nr:hypothetical protein BDV96DRAFT_653880 [Lophiotrema nucula]